MAWVKLEDSIVEHRKHLRAGPAACWLWVCGIAYCQRQLSDGFIPDEAVTFLGVAKGLNRLTARLVDVGLFDRVEGGFMVHDYLDHNLSREAVVVRQSEQHGDKVRAGLAGSRARWQKDSRAIADRASTPMAPSHPIPSHPKKVHTSADADFETFRQAYPVSRRVGGKPGRNAFQRASGRQTLSSMLTALEQHKRSEQWQDPKLIPGMCVWLNQERWTQVLPEPVTAEAYDWTCPHTPACNARHACSTKTALEAARQSA